MQYGALLQTPFVTEVCHYISPKLECEVKVTMHPICLV